MLVRVSTIVCRQALLKPNITQEVNTCRYIHLVSQIKKTSRNNSLLNTFRNYRIIGTPLVRYASTNETLSPSNPFDEIPDPPTPPIQEILENIVKLHPNGEPTLESLGLGSYWPSGLVQQALEFIHIGFDIPWWSAIVIGTITIRTLLFPLVIKAQKNMINFTNHMPTIQKLQMEMTEARQTGDYYRSGKAAKELMQYMKKNKISPIKNAMMPLIQAPIFLSVFMGLRQMANLPVESFKEGGFLWLKDLTIHDPYYIMPIVTCVTLYVTIELGVELGNIKTMGMIRYFLRVLPFVIFPFMINFPGAILTYWASTNLISLIQTSLLKTPYIRKALDMPVLVQNVSPSGSNKSFIEEFKQSWTNIKITKQLSDRERVDAIQFSNAGKGPIVKTFKFDPTKQKQSTVLTKGRK